MNDPLARRPLLRALRNWRERHQHPFSFAIHLIGIPLSVAGVFWFLYGSYVGDLSQWPWMLGLFVVGYILQYIGHCVEGNDMGEFIPLKKLLGLPYVAVAPQYMKEEAIER